MEGPYCYKTIFEALCKRDMGELARAAFDILGMPVVVTDAAFIVRAKYPTAPVADEQWDANVMNRQIEQRFVRTFTDDDHFEHHDLAGHAILTDWGHYATAPRLTAVMRVGTNTVGYFAALATGVEVQEWHYEVADAIADAFAILMEADAGMRLARAHLASPVLYALLDESEGGALALAALPEDFLRENKPPYALLCARPRNPHNAPLETYLGSALTRFFKHSTQTIYDGRLYLLASQMSPGADTGSQQRALAEELARHNLDCGASRVFDDLDEIRLRGWEALSALNVGILVNPGEFLHCYEHHIADVALDCLLSELPADALEHPALVAIKRYDEQNRTEYLKTLRTYFACRFDKKLTSQRLNIHRNTLQYRLDKLQEIEQLNLDDPWLPLYFALEDYQRRIAKAKRFASGKRRS